MNWIKPNVKIKTSDIDSLLDASIADNFNFTLPDKTETHKPHTSKNKNQTSLI